MKKVIEIEKDLLIDLYVNKRKTSYEIAEMLQVSRKTICKRLKQFNIDINPKQRKYELLKKVPLNQEQKEMIIGTMLGDAGIFEHGRKNKSCYYTVGHAEKQKDLVYLKKAILANYVNKINCKIGKNCQDYYYFYTVTLNELSFYRKLFYENNKKIIRDELINYLTPRSLAFWIMDDGSSSKNQNKINIRLHTECFSEEENIKLQSFLKIKFDLRCKVCKFTRNAKEYCYLSFNKENTLKLSLLVEQYFIKALEYKIYRSSTTTCQTSEKDDDIV